MAVHWACSLIKKANCTPLTPTTVFFELTFRLVKGRHKNSRGSLYLGVFLGEKERLVSPEKKIEGRRPKIFNSLAVAKNGDVFWTDSSTDFALADGLFSFLADPTGR